MSSEYLVRDKEIRMKKIDKMMEDLNLDAVLFIAPAQMAYQIPVKYVTGITLGTRRAVAFKERGKEPAFVRPMAVKTKVVNKSTQMQGFILPENRYAGDLIEICKEFIGNMPQTTPRIGLNSAGEIPYEIYVALQGTKAEFIDITREFTIVRSNKSENEIALTKITSDLAVASFEEVVRRIKPGKTESELVGGAIGFLAERGAGELLILATSKRPYADIRKPTDIQVGETDIFTYSAEFEGPGGYWTQVIRPIFMDRNSQQDAYEIWKVALEADQAAARVMRPGKRVCDIHFAIEEVLDKHGMYMSYWAGHGMGCDLGDGVDISPENEMEIVPNMVLTLQPSINSDTNSILFGNTFLSTENGDPICLTGKYMDSPYYEDLYKEICK